MRFAEDYDTDVHLRELVSAAMHSWDVNITARTIDIKWEHVGSEGQAF